MRKIISAIETTAALNAQTRYAAMLRHPSNYRGRCELDHADGGVCQQRLNTDGTCPVHHADDGGYTGTVAALIDGGGSFVECDEHDDHAARVGTDVNHWQCSRCGRLEHR